MCHVNRGITCSILGVTTRQGSNANSEISTATSSGLMRWLIVCCISILSLLASRLIIRWRKPLTDTSKGNAHVRPSWPHPLAGRRARRRAVPLESEMKLMNPDPNSINCSRCGRTINLSAKNAVLHRYLAQPWMTHWVVVCRQCEQYHRCFCRANYKWESDWAERNQVGVITAMFPTDAIVESFEEAFGIQSLPQQELTPSQEKEMLFFRWVMEHDPVERWFDDGT